MIPAVLSAGDLATVIQYARSRTGFSRILTQCIKCTVHEKRNGAFYAEIVVPVKSNDYNVLKNGALLWMKPNPKDNLQCFRVAFEEAAPIKGTALFKANHISYDLKKTSVIPFSSVGTTQTFQRLASSTYRRGGMEFSIATDISSNNSFAVNVPQSARAIMAGQIGSLQDRFGGEWLFDNLSCRLKENRGSFTNLLIIYGLNIIDYRQERNLFDVYTHVQGYAVRNNTTTLGDIVEMISTNDPKYINVDVSDMLSAGETPTVQRVTELTEAYAQSHNLVTPKINIKVDLLDLSKTEEYRNYAAFASCGLCDTVTVRFPSLGVESTAKVIEYDYDVLKESYNSLEIGEPIETIVSAVAQLKKEVKS